MTENNSKSGKLTCMLTCCIMCLIKLQRVQRCKGTSRECRTETICRKTPVYWFELHLVLKGTQMFNCTKMIPFSHSFNENKFHKYLIQTFGGFSICQSIHMVGKVIFMYLFYTLSEFSITSPEPHQSKNKTTNPKTFLLSHFVLRLCFYKPQQLLSQHLNLARHGTVLKSCCCISITWLHSNLQYKSAVRFKPVLCWQ